MLQEVTDKRKEYADSLREFAKFIEDCPSMPAGICVCVILLVGIPGKCFIGLKKKMV